MPDTRTINGVQQDAVNLHALAQGVEILMEESQGDDFRHAGNAAYALIQEVIIKADKLASDLEDLESLERRNSAKAGDA